MDEPGTFTAATNYNVGIEPFGICAGDFNGDGSVDLVVANADSNNISVLLNNGNGSGIYATAVHYATAQGCSGVCSGDFNNDGFLDLVAVNATPSVVSVLLNKGDGTGTFYAANNLSITGAYARSVSVGDYNGDGFLDFAVTNYSQNVAVLLNTRDGSFVEDGSYAAGGCCICIVSGIFDNDNNLDLAVVNSEAGTVSVLYNNGDATFLAAQSYGGVSHPYGLDIGDFNDDGYVDMAVASYFTNRVAIFLNNGNGTFAEAVSYGVGSYPYSLDVGDIDGNGSLDIAVANINSDNVSVLLNNGEGIFAAANNYAVGDYPYAVALGDVKGDEYLDLAVANYGACNAVVLPNEGDGTFGAAEIYLIADSPGSITLNDLNGDGELDLVLTYFYNKLLVMLNNQDGTFAAPQYYNIGYDPCDISASDFNGDGYFDLVTANTDSNSVSVLLNRGDGTFAAAKNYSTGVEPRSVSTGDFNGDGFLDIVTANYDSETLSVLLNNGDGTFAVEVKYLIGSGSQIVRVADFDNDNRLDLAVTNRDGDNVYVLLNTTSFGELAFGEPEYSVSEDGTFIDIEVCRTNGSEGIVTVDYAIDDGTATAGEDYTEVSGTLTFAVAETEKTIRIPIIDDEEEEDDETVELVLSNPTGGALLGAQYSAVLLIVDNEENTDDDNDEENSGDNDSNDEGEEGQDSEVKVKKKKDNKTSQFFSRNHGGHIYFGDLELEAVSGAINNDLFLTLQRLTSYDIQKLFSLSDEVQSKLVSSIYQFSSNVSQTSSAGRVDIKIAYNPEKIREGEVAVLHYYDGKGWIPLFTEDYYNEMSGRRLASVKTEIISGCYAVFSVKPKKCIDIKIGEENAVISESMYTKKPAIITLDAAPFLNIHNSRTLVPVRFISEQMGATVCWNEQLSLAEISQGATIISVKPGEQIILVNGERVEVECGAEIIAPGRLFVPLRFISEILHALVQYDYSSQTCSIMF